MIEKESLSSHIFVGLIFTVISISLILIAWYVIDILLLSFAAILFAIFIRTFSDLFKSWKYMPDSVAVTLALSILGVISLAIIALIAPVVVDQVDQIIRKVPSAWEKLKGDVLYYWDLDSLASLYKEVNLQELFPQGKNIVIQAASLFSTTFGFLGSSIVFLFLGIFFAYDPEVYMRGFVRLFPKDKHLKVYENLDAVGDILRWWLLGKLLSMAIIGMMTSLGLFALGIPLSFTLGLLAALFTFIPNFGPILAAIPAILIAVTQGPMQAVYVIILYCVIQGIEGNIITPIIQNRTMSLPPATTIIAQLMMAVLTGFLGLILATPLLAALSVLIDRIYVDELVSQEASTEKL